MDKQSENQQMRRERATYRYLEALDAGNIDVITEVLQQALYDASLEQMLLEAHQAYFHEEQIRKDALMDMQTQGAIPALIPTKPQETRQNQQKRVAPRWVYTLVAILIVGVLVGSFVTLLNQRRLGAGYEGVPTVPPACQSYPLKQFDVPTNSLTALDAVTAVSTNDAWAVGYASSTPTSPPVSKSPLIEHWDGRSWQFVASPTMTNGNGVLDAVAAVSTNNIWAVGYSFPGSIPPDTSLASVSKTLVEHWNGKSWQIIASPNGPTGNGFFHALTVLSQNDIWAVGSFDDASQVVRPLIEHWNGTNWQIVLHGGSSIGWFNDVAAASANDIWAVGLGRNEGENVTHGLVEHWNGSQWQAVSVSPSMKTLNGVSVLSAKNVWVIGTEMNGGLLLQRWDGQQWNNAALPASLAGKSANLSRIIAVTTDDIWVVGAIQDNIQANNVLLLHWNGTRWQQIHTPPLQLPSNMPNSMASGLAVYGGRQLWIVGDAFDADGGYTAPLILGQLHCT